MEKTHQATWKTHLFLALVAILVLGPLGGIAAAYMNFSLGFFVGGQVLAGLLGSAVTIRYGTSGKHYANYMQTMAASVASMCGMAVLIQGMYWLGITPPPWWQLSTFFLCVGMLAVGIGMAYTPILVDKLKLPFPSGLAVANILRVLTDKNLIKKSLSKLGGGTTLSIVLSAIGLPYDFSAATFGAGMVVGWRIGIAGFVMGIIGWVLTPWMKEIGWLKADDTFRATGYLVCMGMILAAAAVDLTLIGWKAVQRIRGKVDEDRDFVVDAHKINFARLTTWTLFWAVTLVFVSWVVFDIPPLYTIIAIVLAAVMLMVNGISTGIADSNNISVAFIVGVAVLALVGMASPIVAMLCGGILLVSSATGVDMQQDRSTGWRLGTNRTIQFRYQWIGITMGAVLAVVLAQVFLSAYPVLLVNQHHKAGLDQATLDALKGWQSAMTFKLVGIVETLGGLKPYQINAILIGLGMGFIIQIVRVALLKSRGYKAWLVELKTSASFSKRCAGWGIDGFLDVIIFATPYASSFGGFVELPTVIWFMVGGIIASLYTSFEKRRGTAIAGGVPEDMSTASLVGGGSIAGESLWYLYVGLKSLLKTLL